MSERCPHCGKQVPTTLPDKIISLLDAADVSVPTKDIVVTLHEYSRSTVENALQRLKAECRIQHTQHGYWSI